MGNFSTLRVSAGMTQSQLAELSGLRQATISDLENGLTKPRAATVEKLAVALQCSIHTVEEALTKSRQEKAPQILNPVAAASEWAFMSTLDKDLRKGLAEALVSDWTHHSTSLEGNTISAGDTLFIIREGLTISGNSLREHEEIHGHAQAVSIINHWLSSKTPITITQLHELHRAVQTGASVDIFAPVGEFKNESNGTMVITTSGERKWHDYSHPRHTPALMKEWLTSLKRALQSPPLTHHELVRVFTDLHLGFTGIHPYADGNGRLARLLANLPLLKAGQPPLIIQAEARTDYISLMGDYTIAHPASTPTSSLFFLGAERDRLEQFFLHQWNHSLTLVQEFHDRQKNRESN